jgi:hypothetical protein
MSTPQRNVPEELDHPLYEIEMMIETAEKYRAETDRIVANALLESFIVHVRGLDEFFSHKRPRPDDLRPSDFVSGFVPVPEEHPEIDRMNKEIAHLTCSRQRPNEHRRWDFTSTMRPVVVAALEFLREIAKTPDSPLMAYANNRDRVPSLIKKCAQIVSGTAVSPAIMGSSDLPPRLYFVPLHAILPSGNTGCTGPAQP